MDKLVFDFDDYKAYLIARVGHKGQRTGLKSKLALAIGCNTTYISLILNGPAQLSFEQGDKLNYFFEHTEDEGHFFLLLLQLARAGTSSLKKYVERQIERILEQRLNIQKRLGTKSALDPLHQSTIL